MFILLLSQVTPWRNYSTWRLLASTHSTFARLAVFNLQSTTYGMEGVYEKSILCSIRPRDGYRLGTYTIIHLFEIKLWALRSSLSSEWCTNYCDFLIFLYCAWDDFFTLNGHAPFGNTISIPQKSDFKTVLDVIFLLFTGTLKTCYVKSYMREKVILIWTIIILEEGDGWKVGWQGKGYHRGVYFMET